jgi:D-alanine-D-alanine ligase
MFANAKHPSRSWRVALLAGGDSEERAVSLQSGAAVQRALLSRGHAVMHLDPQLVDVHEVDWRGFDVAFIALHGRFGEDGQIQQILEREGIPYTGSPAVASRLAFSKSAAKERFQQHGVPTPHYTLIHYSDDLDRLRRIASSMGFPIVVKPDTQGSSIGVTVIDRLEQVEQAAAACFRYDSFGLMETAIRGTEWTVAVLDRHVLPAIQIETPHAWFDYVAKYHSGATQYRFDYTVPPATVRQIEAAGLAACQVLGTRGLARVDLRVDEDGQPWVLEVNTVPGLTDHSLAPKAAARSGISFADLCEQMILASFAGCVPRPHHAYSASIRQHVG